MPIDQNQTVLFGDGEGLTHGDLNDSQNFARALLIDQMIGVGAGTSPPSIFGYSNKFCWTIGMKGFPCSDTGTEMTITAGGVRPA